MINYEVLVDGYNYEERCAMKKKQAKKQGSGKLIMATNSKAAYGNNKVPMNALPAAARIYGALAMKSGNDKYGFYNFRQSKVSLIMYLDAIDRHEVALVDGEDLDRKSGHHHAAMILASAAIILDAYYHGNLVDDRPPPGPAADILEREAARMSKKRRKKSKRR